MAGGVFLVGENKTNKTYTANSGFLKDRIGRGRRRVIGKRTRKRRLRIRER